MVNRFGGLVKIAHSGHRMLRPGETDHVYKRRRPKAYFTQKQQELVSALWNRPVLSDFFTGLSRGGIQCSEELFGDYP
jgi:hypothetical protein